jgi:hypothetical protein
VKTIWREVVLVETNCYPVICLDGLRKTTENLRISFVSAEIRTEHIPNTSRLESCLWTGVFVLKGHSGASAPDKVDPYTV